MALGLIETVGFTTAVSAADAAVKAADVEIVGLEKIIGVKGYVGVTIHLTGDVAAVTSAVEAGKAAGERIGQIISTEVIARAHSDVTQKLISQFAIKNVEEKTPKKQTGSKSTSSPKARKKKNDEKKE